MLITLRGKVDLVGGGDKKRSWKWTGHWAFGTSAQLDDPKTRLPFVYNWEQEKEEEKEEPKEEIEENKAVQEETKNAEKEDENQDNVVSDQRDQSTTSKEAGDSNKPQSEKIAATAGTTTNQNQQISGEKSKLTVKKFASLPVTVTSRFPSSFTDASGKHPDLSQIPLTGLWRGHFETPSGRKTGPNLKIKEYFWALLNASPPENASSTFDNVNSKTFNDTMIHVTGNGENQYGIFELVGFFDVANNLLEVQRRYTKTYDIPTTPTVGRGRGRGRRASYHQSPMTESERSHNTRKRQLSWKRRASYDGSEDDPLQSPYSRRASTGGAISNMSRKRSRGDSAADESGIPTSKNTSNNAKISAVNTGGKRLRSPSPNSPKRLAAVSSTSIMPPGPPLFTLEEAAAAAAADALAATTFQQQQQSQQQQTNSIKKRNSPSAGQPDQLTSGKGGLIAGNAGQMKLPTSGDPKKARWRAAHFLYYQKIEKPPEPEDATNLSSSAAAAAGSDKKNNAGEKNSDVPPTTPKYVVYEGELWNSQRDGRGVCLYSNSMMYEGGWHRDKEHGYGTLMTADRSKIIYEGEWERGKMHGQGVYYYGHDSRRNSKEATDDTKNQSPSAPQSGPKSPGEQQQEDNDSRYEGEFKENLRHGMGTYVFPDGSVYSGMWREGTMTGRGVFTWPDGSVYDGEWKNGKRHGNGLLKASDGFVYDGVWVQNTMEGRGSATYPNGQQYNGLFSHGCREGRGTLLFTNGAVYEGRFREDAIDGQGTMKISRPIVVPEKKADEDAETAEKEDNKEGKKNDFMIPVYFQSDMGHIHRRAGFTVVGE